METDVPDWSETYVLEEARDGQRVESEMTQKGWHRSRLVSKLDGRWT